VVAVTKLEDARQDLERAIALAGLQGDPLRPVLQAIGGCLVALDEVASRSAEPLSPAEREKLVTQLGRAAQQVASDRNGALVKAAIIRGATWGGGMAAVAAAVLSLGGYWLGQRQVLNEAQAYVAAHTARIAQLADGPKLTLPDAAAWSAVIAQNPSGAAVVGTLSRTQQMDDTAKRRFGTVYLWLDPPHLSPRQ
jgi:hypothetical protein